MSKKLVLMDHDGAIDDFLATILLVSMQETVRQNGTYIARRSRPRSSGKLTFLLFFVP